MFKAVILALNILVSTVSFNPTAYSLIDCSHSSNLAIDLAAYIDKVPDSILDMLKEEGYSISLSEQPGSAYDVKYIDGITDTTQNLIIIKKYKGKFRKSVIHEIGHAVDDCLDFPSKSESFNSIYEDEKEQIIVTGVDNPSYCKQSSQEYFAEAFQMYIYNPEVLKSSVPKTYSFIDKMMTEIER